MKTILRSEHDRSINIITPHADGGAVESRFVQRTDDTIIIYLSSATGCDRACRFCHLTQMRQTMSTFASVKDYLDQAREHLLLAATERRLGGVDTVHFNFMARGDALLNPRFVHDTDYVILGLVRLAEQFGLKPKFKISTIFPTSPELPQDEYLLTKWVQMVSALHPEVEFYYSLYSLDPTFRKRWIPKALDPELVGRVFSKTVGKLRLHHALIDGENTSTKTIASIGQWLERHDIHCRFNLVRYNPFDKVCGQEASDDVIELHRVSMEKMARIISAQVVSRVGKDVAASCGMFIS